MSNIESLRKRLKEAMGELGITQAELARRIDLTRAAVNAWFVGRVVNIRPEHLFAAADALGVEARWLATGKGPKKAIGKTDLELLGTLARLNEQERSAVGLLVTQVAEAHTPYKR